MVFRSRAAGIASLASLAMVAVLPSACSSEAPAGGGESASIGVSRQAATASFVLFSTGVDATGAQLAASAVDPHYALSASNDPTYPRGSARVDPNTKLGGGWNPAGATSQWISPSGDSCAATCAAATYDYTTTFSLPSGGTASTATISAQVNADDNVTVLLNDVVVGVPILTAWAAPARAFTVPAGAGFRTGANTLTFRVQNTGGGATGLDVRQISGTFTSGCVLDADCSGTPNTYCDGRTLGCVTKLANEVAIPIDGLHVGLCTASVGSAVCAAGVCDAASSTCGVPLGSGPCTASSQCDSGVCVTTGPSAGTCRACETDATCSGATPACDGATNACVACTASNLTACTAGTPVCDAAGRVCVACARDFGASGAAACPSAVKPFCAASGACGTCTSNASCGGAHAGGICNTTSGACGAGCGADGDCPGGFCDNPSAAPFGGTCSPKLANGTKVPADAPTLGHCTSAVGARVCTSGACDAADDACGVVNGGGCATATVCRSGLCGVGGLCGNANGEACTTATVEACRSLVCDDDGACGRPDGKGPCTVDAQCRNQPCVVASQRCGCSDDAACTGTEFCRMTTRACTPRLGNGASCARNIECTSGLCTSGSCGPGVVSDAGAPDAGGSPDGGGIPDGGAIASDGGADGGDGADADADGATEAGGGDEDGGVGGSGDAAVADAAARDAGDAGRRDGGPAEAGADASAGDQGLLEGGGFSCSLGRAGGGSKGPGRALALTALGVAVIARRRRRRVAR